MNTRQANRIAGAAPIASFFLLSAIKKAAVFFSYEEHSRFKIALWDIDLIKLFAKLIPA